MERREAQRILSQQGFVLDEQKQPDLGAVKEFGPRFLGKTSVESMDLSAYYESSLPYFRSPDRAKEQAVAFFEGKCGRIADVRVKNELIGKADTVGEVFFLNARDKDGRRTAVIVDKAQLEEVGVKAPVEKWKPRFT